LAYGRVFEKKDSRLQKGFEIMVQKQNRWKGLKHELKKIIKISCFFLSIFPLIFSKKEKVIGNISIYQFTTTKMNELMN